MEEIIRQFMLEHVSPQWAQLFKGEPGKVNLAYILARRLSTKLTGTELPKVIKDAGLSAVGETAHPLQYYVMPPIATTPVVGDLHHSADTDEASGSGSWRIVLTPSCDLVWGKADFALLARCRLLEQTKAFRDVAGHAKPSNAKKAALKDILTNRSARCYYLPEAFDIPHLIVDFQDLLAIGGDTLRAMRPTASLDSPYAEELQSRFAAYFGRIGTPDLDSEALIEKIRKQD